MLHKLYKFVFDKLSKIEQKIPWNTVLQYYEPLILVFIMFKIGLFIFGIFNNIPNYIIYISSTATNIIYILISLYIIIKFGPWSKSKFVKKDSNIIYRAGLLLFSSSILGQFIKSNTIIVQHELLQLLTN